MATTTPLLSSTHVHFNVLASGCVQIAFILHTPSVIPGQAGTESAVLQTVLFHWDVYVVPLFESAENGYCLWLPLAAVIGLVNRNSKFQTAVDNTCLPSEH